MITCDYAQSLQSLAETHVITEDTVQMVFSEEIEPVDTILLVRTQLSLDGDRQRERLDLLGIQELADECSLTISALEQLL